MEIDNITYEDLSLYSHEEEFSIFHKLDFTRTTGGKDCAAGVFQPSVQQAGTHPCHPAHPGLMLEKMNQWPSSISNGTIMVMEKFYETALDDHPPGREPAGRAEL
jgi:DNA mismatch repair protein MutS